MLLLQSERNVCVRSDYINWVNPSREFKSRKYSSLDAIDDLPSISRGLISLQVRGESKKPIICNLSFVVLHSSLLSHLQLSLLLLLAAGYLEKLIFLFLNSFITAERHTSEAQRRSSPLAKFFETEKRLFSLFNIFRIARPSHHKKT